ncbi:DUF4292 domain-containing protein [Neolewinella persica]|uniref:DUF4292 domain-containing protein n=1 Tax=Neolewinella persica TaxID=70998 RepID=UPI00035E2805|nr:DUF4292 domain-containing protein [Neolewinella persica]
MRTYLLLACTCLFFFFACKVKVGAGKDGRDGVTTVSKAAKVIKGMEDNSFDAEFMEGRANIKLESRDFNIGGTAVIRMEKDKAIWMSVKKFGFEGARALIRPDSFFVLNRLNGDYTAEPLSYIEQKYKIPARFDLLQEAVLGNAVFFTRDLDLKTEGETYLLSGRDQRFATNYKVGSRGFKLEEMELKELVQNRSLTINNADFRQAEGKTGEPDFAHSRTLRIDAEATGPAKLDLKFTRLSFSGPLDMPFQRR